VDTLGERYTLQRTGNNSPPVTAESNPECRAGDVVVGVAATLNERGFVRRVAVRCASLDIEGRGLCAERYWQGKDADTSLGAWRDAECPAGQMMVGMRTYMGDILDGFAPICAPFGWTTGSARNELPRIGGNGGTAVEHLCPIPGAAMVRFLTQVLNYGGPVTTWGIYGFCRALNPRTTAVVTGAYEVRAGSVGEISLRDTPSHETLETAHSGGARRSQGSGGQLGPHAGAREQKDERDPRSTNRQQT